MANRLIVKFLIILFCLSSCDKSDTPPAKVDQTVFMYLPWSTDLTDDFRTNITDMKRVIEQGVLQDERVVVYFATSQTEATLFELVYDNGDCVERHLKSYTNPKFTTAAGITSILNDMKRFAPANRYGMTIGCHGLGWIPVNYSSSRALGQKFHWEYEDEGMPKTRFFGGQTTESRTDITTLAEGIANAGMKMEYILFDDCYMSTVEVAYELKEVTDYLIACPTEIMAYGMPYAKIGHHLIGNVDYYGICEEFYNFYSTYTVMPCGTIGVTKCSELDNLAKIMKEINSRFTFDSSLTGSIQRMDGYSPGIFFDCAAYVTKLCTDEDLLDSFETQLERTIPYKRHTNYFYARGRGQVKINTYSGTTLSDPSINSAAASKAGTAWYKATH